MASKQRDGVSAWTTCENNCFPNAGTRPGLTGQQRLFHTLLCNFILVDLIYQIGVSHSRYGKQDPFFMLTQSALLTPQARFL